MPANFQGNAPYCRYTAAPGKGGGWTAPDMAQARRLVAASGRAGERVVVPVPDFREAVGRYVAKVLGELGFRTTLRMVAFNDPEGDSRTQIGFTGWLADYLGGVDLHRAGVHLRATGRVQPLLHLRPEAGTSHRPRGVTRPADAGRAWAAADRRVADLAPVVPLTQRRSAVLVSKRAANVQTHGQWFTLLDQMWVR